jgi:hypothetical protein
MFFPPSYAQGARDRAVESAELLGAAIVQRHRTFDERKAPGLVSNLTGFFGLELGSVVEIVPTESVTGVEPVAMQPAMAPAGAAALSAAAAAELRIELTVIALVVIALVIVVRRLGGNVKAETPRELTSAEAMELGNGK